jgi:hypothetical protein
MAGNVWEWTRGLEKPYSYDPVDGRAAIDEKVDRVLQGGSLQTNARNTRCACRNRNHLDIKNDNVGFPSAGQIATAPPPRFVPGAGPPVISRMRACSTGLKGTPAPRRPVRQLEPSEG